MASGSAKASVLDYGFAEHATAAHNPVRLELLLESGGSFSSASWNCGGSSLERKVDLRPCCKEVVENNAVVIFQEFFWQTPG